MNCMAAESGGAAARRWCAPWRRALRACGPRRRWTIFLANGDVNALNAGAFLVDDGVDGDRGLAGLAVADDQLALAAADGHHGVDGLETGLHRLIDRLTADDAGCDLLDGEVLRRSIGPLPSMGCPGSPPRAQQGLAHRHFQNAPGALHRVAFRDVLYSPSTTAPTESRSRFRASP